MMNGNMPYDLWLLQQGTYHTGGKGIQHIKGVALLCVDDGESIAVGPRAQHRGLHHAHLAARDHHLEHPEETTIHLSSKDSQATELYPNQNIYSRSVRGHVELHSF